MKRPVQILILVLVLTLSAGVAAALYFNRTDPSSVYRTAKVRRADIVKTINASGTIVPEDVVDVGAQINGQIASFGKDKEGKTVDYRSTVDEGMVLALIDDVLYNADVATAEAQLAQSQAQVSSSEAGRDLAKAKLDEAQRDWDRAQKLSGSPALSQVDYDTARSNFEQAKASLALAEAAIGEAHASVAMAQASVQRARRNLTFCTIRSPVDGVVLDRRVEIGQTVVASLNAPSLFLLAKDLRRMKVLVQVNEADIGQVQPGQAVTFTADAYPDQTFRGEVRKVRLNATQTQNVVTYTVEIVTDNADLKLLPYLTANVTFEVSHRDDVLAVPNSALRWAPRDAPARDTARDTSSAPATASAAGPDPSAVTKTTTDGPSDPVVAGQASKADGAEAVPPNENARPSRAQREAGAGARQGGGSGRRSGQGAGGSGKGGDRARGPGKSGIVWILQDGQLHSIRVRTGLSDGTLTEIEGDALAEGTEVIVGDRLAGASTGAAAATSTNPFAPPPRTGGGRGGR